MKYFCILSNVTLIYTSFFYDKVLFDFQKLYNQKKKQVLLYYLPWFLLRNGQSLDNNFAVMRSWNQKIFQSISKIQAEHK